MLLVRSLCWIDRYVVRQPLDERSDFLLPVAEVLSRLPRSRCRPLDHRPSSEEVGADLFQPVTQSPRRKAIVTVIARDGGSFFLANVVEIAELQARLYFG